MKLKKNIERWAFPLICLLVGVLGGILMGIQIQQMIFIAGMVEFGESLEGTDIEINVDLNETQLVEGFKEIMMPVFNQSLTEEDLK